jgi:hypothetical protein
MIKEFLSSSWDISLYIMLFYSIWLFSSIQIYLDFYEILLDFMGRYNS